MAVNAYMDERRMTEDVDIVATSAEPFAESLRQHLNQQLPIAVRIRTLRDGVGLRLYQLTTPKNRHLGLNRDIGNG